MAIRFAVLALLAEAPLHGYAVHALCEERLGDFFDLSYGQVYQVLTALERQGLVLATRARVGRRPWRKVYDATPSGREVLERWLRGHRVRPRAFRDDFYLRLYFAAASRPRDIGRIVSEQIARAESDVLALRTRLEAVRGAARAPDAVRRSFLEAAVLHAEATVRALERTREALRAFASIA
ncbi:MAG TPA: PadR family transcriptional regulator [Candidatus Binatia bacterium]|nr:PadR family transcriptional regulator [Candidatus Binatia bacterium]